MIFGVFELAEMFSSFIFGKYLNSIGSKFMLITGAAGIGVNSLLFGWVIQTRNGHTFLVCCIIIRIFKGLSSSAVSIASFAILAHEYSGSLSTIVGVLETCCGIGVIGGPPLGGLLYFYGGFKLPFILVGAMSSLASGIGYFLLPSYEDRWMVRKSYLPLMKQWELFFPLTTLVIATSTMSFLDLALAPFVEQFNHSSEMVGLMFMVSSVSYILTAPLWGLLVDKKGCTKSVMMFGSFITATAFFLLGALPMLDGQLMNRSMGILWGSLAFVGIGLGAQIIPPFDDTLRTASRCGYLVSFDTLGLVSGLTNAGYSFGSFLGPALGGIGVKELGFYWSGTALSIMNASIGILFVTYFSVRWCCSQASDDVFRN